jgi:hypothetical protein
MGAGVSSCKRLPRSHEISVKNLNKIYLFSYFGRLTFLGQSSSNLGVFSGGYLSAVLKLPIPPIGGPGDEI